jgi:hypothetical protein
MIATQFTETEWNKIIQPALQATLNSAGMAKLFPRKVLYGPELYQGMDMKHPFFLQEISHIMTHVQEAVCQSQTGQMIQMTAEAFRMEIGVPFSLNKTVYDDQRYAFYTPKCWYKTLWKFVSSDEFKIEIEEDYQDLKELQEHAVFIMEQFVERGYVEKDLPSLNYVRKFLKAITLADIAMTNGVYISHNAFEAKSGNRLQEGLGWPWVPEVLTQPFIKLWKEATTLCFLNPYNHTNEKRKIQNSQQLGDWHKLEVKNKTWECFLWENEDKIYKRDGNTGRVHSKTGRRQYSYLGNYEVCPNQDTIASVYEQGGRVYVETTSTFETADLACLRWMWGFLNLRDTSRQGIFLKNS